VTASAPPPDRPLPLRPGGARVTGIVGTLGGLALGACFFLAWLSIDRGLGERFRDDVGRAVRRLDEPTQAERDLERLGGTLATEGVLTGADVILWVRTAESHHAALDEGAGTVTPADAVMDRRLRVVRVVLYALPTLGFLLAAYFLFHRLRRVRSPILILCILTGLVAVALAGALEYAHAVLQGTVGEDSGAVRLGPGHAVLKVAGVGLALAGIFGVGARNWFRVYAGSVITAACLALIVWRYLQTGATP
jgi:hypothetical protein